ncbi:hypothetical protein QMU90_002337 [Edwardsiella ictaluri]|nr:hypothetical protein [Edwardsiella ictaluri]
MPIDIEKTLVIVTFCDGVTAFGHTRMPPERPSEWLTIYTDESNCGRIINMKYVRDIEYRMIERKAK